MDYLIYLYQQLSVTNSINIPTDTDTNTDIKSTTDTDTDIPTNTDTDIKSTTDTDIKSTTDIPTDIDTDTNIKSTTDTNIPTNNLIDTPTNIPTNNLIDTPTNIPTNIPTNNLIDIHTNIPTNNLIDIHTNIPTNNLIDTPTSSLTAIFTSSSVVIAPSSYTDISTDKQFFTVYEHYKKISYSCIFRSVIPYNWTRALAYESKITQSYLQDSCWRLRQEWYMSGKRNECEKYQTMLLECITGQRWDRTYIRIDKLTNKLVVCADPYTRKEGFEYTENFDAVIGRTLYNFKFVCSSGGAQTRTLKDVYGFIESQLNYLLSLQNISRTFVNILDGDASFYSKDKFQYLLNKPKYINVRKYVYVGDMHGYQQLLFP